MMSKIRRKIYTTLSILLSFITLSQPMQTQQAMAWDPAKWAFCDLWDDWGPRVYKAGTTDWIPHVMASKSTTNTMDNAKSNVYNQVLNVAGYKIGKPDASNPFDRFGLSGIKYTSYTGEWKYYDIDPCDDGDRQSPVSTNFGEFYEGRLDPISTYEEIHNTTDVRTKEYARGRMSALWKAIKDNVCNFFIAIAKWVVTITLALISLSFTDITELVGFGQQAQENMFLSLYNSIFAPLVVIMFLFTACYIMYHGLWKMEFRTAVIGGIVKPIGSLLLTLLLVANPSWVALPNKLVTLVQSLVVSGMTNSITGDGSDSLCEKQTGDVITNTDSPDFLTSQADYMKSVIGCRIWSEYLFKPLVKGQFGTDYKDLEKLKNENEKWVGKPKVDLGKKTIENWGLFHVSVMSGTHQPIDGMYTANVGDINKDYYRIVDALSNYDETVIAEGVDFGGSGNGSSSSGKGTKGRRAANAEEFFKKHGKFAKKVADEAGIYASVLLAQAAMETGYGVAMSAPHNYFGIKCSPNYPCGASVKTQEEVNGKLITINAQFRAFKDDKDGFEGYARFLHGEGAGADYSGAFKKNAKNPEEAIKALGKAGYFTSTTYVGHIMSLIKTYDLTQYDTKNKNGTKLSKYKNKNTGGNGKSSGTSGGNSSSSVSEGGGIVVEPKNNPPLEQWNSWIGNNGGERFGYALIMLLFSIVGSFGPFIFSLLSSVYSLFITLLAVMAPIFLLFGCWGGKGNSILMKYLGTFLSAILKKLAMTFLMIVSIIIITNTFALMSTEGYLTPLILMCVLTYILIKQKSNIVRKLSAVGMPTFSAEPMDKMTRSAKTAATDTAQLTAGAAIGGAAAVKAGGKFKSGASEAFRYNLRQKMYRSEIGRKANAVYETYGKNKAKLDDPVKYCVDCGIQLQEGDEVYIDENGNYFCDTCASALGYEGMTGTFIDNEDDEKFELTRDRENVEIVGADGEMKSTSYLTREELSSIGINQENLEWSDVNQNIQERVNDSMILLYRDLGEAKKVDRPIRNPFIPEPLRNTVSNSEVLHLIRKNDLDGYADLMERSWADWYTKQSRKHNSETTTDDIKKMQTSFKSEREKYMGN